MDDTSAPVSLFHSYDEEHCFLEKVLRDEAAAKPGLRVLEAGCGQRWWCDLSGLDVHLTGVDIDPAAMEIRLRVQHDLQEAVVGDLHTVRLPEASFDVIYSAFVLEHVQDPDLVMRNFVRWLRPGGLMILKLPDRESVKGFITRSTPHWFHVLYYRWYCGVRDAGTPGHVPYPTYYGAVVSSRGMHRFCDRHGLQIEAEFGRASHVDNSGALFHAVLRTVGAASFGRLRSDYTDLDYVIRKPSGRAPAYPLPS